MKCFRRQETPLYVILPYFNFCGVSSRHRLFVECVQRLKGVHVVIVEALSSRPLPCFRNVFKHIKVRSSGALWIKESLVNIGIRSLPNTWSCVAWIDADITFTNPHWVKDTLRELETHDVVQMFERATYLGPVGEKTKTDRGFGYMYRTSEHPYHKTDRYGFWHPGFAWACTRSAWTRMGGLLDWAPLGSADRHMALALIEKVDWSAPGNIHPNYKMLLQFFQKKCTGLSLGYVRGDILHHWHGSLENRKYRERWDILTRHKFDPLSDVEYRDDVLCLTSRGARLQKEIEQYFIDRREDEDA